MIFSRILAICNLLALLLHISFSYLSQFRLINELNVGEISDAYDSLFTPAGVTFAIWGVIYAALLFLCGFHLVMAFRKGEHDFSNRQLRSMGPWFILNNLGAATWLYCWTHNQIAASLGLIFFQLLAIVIIHLRLNIHDPQAPVSSKVFTQFPLSIYFGWLCIAAIANTCIFLVPYMWKGYVGHVTAFQWTRIMIGVAVFLSVWIIFARRNVFFGLVIVWALYGIVLKRQAVNQLLYEPIINTAWIGLGIVAAAAILQLIFNLTDRQPGGTTKTQVATNFDDDITMKR